MKKFGMTPGILNALLIGSVAVLGIALTGCMSAEEQRYSNLREDGGTCSDFGARYGSRGHTQCMLQQQQRRDNEQVLNMERARISSEQARNNLEMLKIIRERRGSGNFRRPISPAAFRVRRGNDALKPNRIGDAR